MKRRIAYWVVPSSAVLKVWLKSFRLVPSFVLALLVEDILYVGVAKVFEAHACSVFSISTGNVFVFVFRW